MDIEEEVKDSVMDESLELVDNNNGVEEGRKVKRRRVYDVKVVTLPECTTTLEYLFNDPEIIKSLTSSMSISELQRSRLLSNEWNAECIQHLEEFATKPINNKFIKKITLDDSFYTKFDSFKTNIINYSQLFTRFEFDYNFIQNSRQCYRCGSYHKPGDIVLHSEIMDYLKKFKMNKLAIVNIILEKEKEEEKEEENDKKKEKKKDSHKIDQSKSWEKVHQILQHFAPTIQSLKIWDVRKFEMSQKDKEKCTPIKFDNLEKLKVSLTYAQCTFPDEYYEILSSILNLSPKLNSIKCDSFPVNQSICDMLCPAYKFLVTLDIVSWSHCGLGINLTKHLENLNLKELKVGRMQNNYESFNILLGSQCTSLEILSISFSTYDSVPDKKFRISFPRFEKLQNLTLLMKNFRSDNNKIWSDFIQPVRLAHKFPQLHTLKINKMDKFHHICIGGSNTLKVLQMDVEHGQQIKYTQLKTWFPNIVEFTTKIKLLPGKGVEIPWTETLQKLTLDLADVDLDYLKNFNISHLTGLKVLRITDWRKYYKSKNAPMNISWRNFKEFLQSLTMIQALKGHDLKWLLFKMPDYPAMPRMKPSIQKKMEEKISDFSAQNQMRFAFYEEK